MRFKRLQFFIFSVFFLAVFSFISPLYAACDNGPINEACLCNNIEYTTGYCCNNIWFDSHYKHCPTGNFYFVDPDHPTDSNDNSGSEDSPWSDPHIGAQRLYPGDVLLIKKGTYSRFTGIDHRGEPGIYAVRSGTEENPIIIKAYPGHDVQLIGGIESGDPTLDTSPLLFTNPAIGTEWDTFTDYIIIDGFRIHGAATLGSTTGSVLKNCEITGGGDSEFGSCIRVEEATDCTVRNNIVHDNINSGDSNGSPLLMGFDSTNVIIEHNEFYNANTHAILYKDDPENIQIRYNIIRDNPHDAVWTANQDQGHNVYIYQNIFQNNGYAGFDAGLEAAIKVAICVENVQIFNNLFIDNIDDIANMDGAGNGCVAPSWQSWNNIFSSPAQYNYSIKNPGEISFLQYSDFNLYHDTLIWHHNSDIFGLIEWQTHSLMDNNSITGDPLFLNAIDFIPSEFSPAIGSGIDRQDHDNDGDIEEKINIGPYINGKEVIGVDILGISVDSSNNTSDDSKTDSIDEPQTNTEDISVSGGCGFIPGDTRYANSIFFLLLISLLLTLFNIKAFQIKA